MSRLTTAALTIAFHGRNAKRAARRRVAQAKRYVIQRLQQIPR